MKWMKDPLAGFISRCGARMGKFTALLVTIAMLAGTTGAGATAFADETVTDGGNVAAESAASQPESTQQSDAENAVGSDVADIAGQDVAGQSATDDDDAQCLTDDGESQQPSNEQAQSQPEQPSETMPEQRQPCDKTEQPNEQKEQERQAVRQPTAENADVPANGAAPAQDGDRNDHAGDADDADNDGNTAEDADDADKNGKNDADKDAASAQNGNDNDKNDAAKDDADADEHIMRDRFTFNRKTVMRAAANEAVQAPDHAKSITYNGGGKYTLNLNVVGKQSSTSQTVSQPVDIALVLDSSGSMNYCMNGDQPSLFNPYPCRGDNVVRSAALQTAVTAFLDGVDTQNKTIANADNKVQVSLVSFADSAVALSGLTPEVAELKAKVKNFNPGGATNTADGFSKAKSTLDKDTRTNAIKYVVFFTDGVPTTSSAFDNTVANNTLETAKQLKGANVGVYSVGIFSGAKTSVTSCNRQSDKTRKANVFMNAVSSNYPNYGSVAWESGVTLSGGSDKGYYKTASTASELSKVFEDIQQTITTTNGYTGVTIQDTLSEYAEFADADHPAKTAKVVANGDTDVTAQWNIKVNGKTITASPKSTEPLPDGVTYTLQFDIKPTQRAYDDYVANKNAGKDGYNGVIGSADSDAAGNATSVDKSGFYTNDSACLAYSGDGETHDCSDTSYTERPVDQVKTGAITVQKKWADADGKASSEGNPESVLFTLQIDGIDSKREAMATADTGWTASFENLAPGHTYKVIEKAVEGYETSYESQEVAITADELWKAKFDVNTADNVMQWNVTVTNTHKKSTLAEGSIKVSKSISGREWKNGDSFNFTIVGSGSTQNAPLPDPASITINANTAKYEASFGKIVYKTAGTYTYTVKETKPTNAIAGLHYSQAEYTVTVTVPADMGTPKVSIKQVKDDNGDNGEAVDDNQSANVAKFTNTYVAVSALPLTGGMTDRQWLFVGGAVGGLAVLLIGAAGVWNGKKRLV